MRLPARRISWLLALLIVLVGAPFGAFYIIKGPRGKHSTSNNAPPTSVESLPGPIRFREMSAGSGVEFSYRNGEESKLRVILESLGGGAGLFDYDGDGRLDLFVVGGGRFISSGQGHEIEGLADRLYRNEGGWHFRDVTAEVGLSPTGRYGHGCAAADYDNDGDTDLLVTGYGGITLYSNEGGRRLRDITAGSGMDQPGGWCTGAAWADFDNDGRLDLYVVRYVDWSWANNPPCRYPISDQVDLCSPMLFRGQTDLLYHNEGDGRFTEVASRAGLIEEGKGLGVVACDLDGDRDIDLYIANDTSGNHLYRNRGDGSFEEVGKTSGAAFSSEGIANGSMGVDAADSDGDGDLDLWVSNYEGETNELYRNDGAMSFIPVGMATGLGAPSRPMVGWGTGLVDFDNDGRLDVLVANGHLMHHLPGSGPDQRPLLFRQSGGRFHDVGLGAGPYFSSLRSGRGCAFGDLDDDGDSDVVIVHQNQSVVLLRNDSARAGSGLRLRLEGRVSNRSAIGATVVVSVGKEILTRTVRGGGSYLSQSDLGLIIGLGEAREADHVEIRWPSGQTDRHGRLTADKAWRLRETDPPRGDARAQ
jgi:enediyne biosynthesis protein E4